MMHMIRYIMQACVAARASYWDMEWICGDTSTKYNLQCRHDLGTDVSNESTILSFDGPP